MGTIEKTHFPFLFDDVCRDQKAGNIVVFFGGDVPNFPGWNKQLYLQKTNQMLDYIRRYFPGRELLYLAHPNETDEQTFLHLAGFRVGEPALGELYLYDNRSRVEYVFSACSGACISAYEMGFNAAVFLDSLVEAIAPADMLVYRSRYFAGLPEPFFISSFEKGPPLRSSDSLTASRLFPDIQRLIGGTTAIWFLVSEPSKIVKVMLLAQYLKRQNPERPVNLIKFSNRRWLLTGSRPDLFEPFKQVVEPKGEFRMRLRLKHILSAVHFAHALRRLPINASDSMVSFCHAAFHENCILSYFNKSTKVALIENYAYHFAYEIDGADFKQESFYFPKAVRLFNTFLAPLLGVYHMWLAEYAGCKVLGKSRFSMPLESIYDATYVLMP